MDAGRILGIRSDGQPCSYANGIAALMARRPSDGWPHERADRRACRNALEIFVFLVVPNSIRRSALTKTFVAVLGTGTDRRSVGTCPWYRPQRLGLLVRRIYLLQGANSD